MNHRREVPLDRLAEALLQCSDDAIVAEDPHGRILCWNPAAEMIYGYSEDEILGRSAQVLVPPERTEELQSILERIRRGERVDSFDTERIRKDGTRVPVSVTVSPIVSADGTVLGASSIEGDIRERKEGERRLRHLAAIVASSDDAIIGKTLDGIVTSWNQGAELLYGWSAEEMLGQHISRVVPRQKQEELDEIMARLRRGERIRSFRTLRCDRHGREFPVSLTVSPIELDDGSLVGASAIARDVGEQRAVEDALHRAIEQGEAGTRAKDRFMATVSHELRTPLNAILGYAALLADEIGGGLTEDQRVQVDRIQGGVRALMSLIEQILDYSRARAGEAVPRMEKVNLRRLVRETAELMRPEARAKGLTLEVEIPDSFPEVRTDGGIVRKALLNLMSNAVKFTGEGSVRVELERLPGDRAAIRVRDTGPGIDPVDRDRIFRPFFQLGSFQTRTVGGAGLGLSVSYELVRLIGGDIRVDDGSEGGSVFILELPLELPRPRADGAAGGTSGERAAGSRRGAEPG